MREISEPDSMRLWIKGKIGESWFSEGKGTLIGSVFGVLGLGG